MSNIEEQIAKTKEDNATPIDKRIGIAKNKLVYPDDIHAYDDEVKELFEETSAE